VRFIANRRASSSCRCETGSSRWPFTRPHGLFRYRSAQAGSKFLPYLFKSMTPVREPGLPRLPSSTCLENRRGALQPRPVVRRPSATPASSNLPAAPLQGLPFRINALSQVRPAGGLPSETPDFPLLPNSPCYSLRLPDHRVRFATFPLACCSAEIACLGDLFTKPLLFPKFPG
jgi:hypothetical protein